MRTTSPRHPQAVKALILATLFGATCGLFVPSLAGSKPIDWDKKLAKPRHLLETNNVEEAIKIYAVELKKHPEAAPPHTDLGKAYKVRGKLALAKSEFLRATEVDPSYAEAWYELGAMQESDKDFQLALNAYEKYIQLAPGSDRKASVLQRVEYCKNRL